MNYFIVPGLKHRKELPTPLKFVNSNRIINAVEMHFNISFEKIIKKNRIKSILYPRQICIYLIHKNTNLTLSDIGKMFKKDHTTILASVKRMQDLMDTEPNIMEEVKLISETI